MVWKLVSSAAHFDSNCAILSSRAIGFEPQPHSGPASKTVTSSVFMRSLEYFPGGFIRYRTPAVRALVRLSSIRNWSKSSRVILGSYLRIAFANFSNSS
jgi:hypothetical protein